jgi:hypothetical protein
VLDGLVKGGLALTNAHAHVPLTLPSHATLMTGRLPPALELHDNAPFPLRGDVPTLASWLQARGYATDAVIGGQPLARGSGIERGFDEFDDPPRGTAGVTRFGERKAAEVTDHALVAWTRSAGDRPRFLFVHYFDPHQPYEPPPELIAGDPRDPAARYLGEVAYVDRELGRLLTGLRATGERCLLYVGSDHGEGLGDHGESTHGYQVFESTLHVPMVLAEIEGAKTSRPRGLSSADGGRLVGMVDVLPTLMRELGVPAPEGLDGIALQDPPPPHPACYVESLAGSLQLGHAQITGARGEHATLLRAGRDVPATIDGVGAIVVGSDDERTLVDVGGLAPADEVASAWRAALVAARTASLPPVTSEPSVAPLFALGYAGGSTDRARHALAPFAENATRVSPLARIGSVERLIGAIESLERHDADGAARGLTALVEAEPENPTALFFRARARLALEDRTHDGRFAREAAADLAGVLAIDPSYAGAPLLRIKALGSGGDFDAAFATLTALEKAGESAPLHHLRGSLLLAREAGGRRNPLYDAEAGYGHLLRSLELDPSQAGLADDVEAHLRALEKSAAPPPWLAAALARLDQVRRRRDGRYRGRGSRYPFPNRARIPRRTSTGRSSRHRVLCHLLIARARTSYGQTFLH